MHDFARATHVGSLLRPPQLLAARADYAEGRIDAEQLRTVEDRAILVALAMQRECGLGVYTDGEYRRADFMSRLADGVNGFVEQAPTLEWEGPDGERAEDDGVLKLIGGKLTHRVSFTHDEAAFLRLNAPGPHKIALPDVTNFVVANWQGGVSDGPYPTRADIVDDLADVLSVEIERLAGDGIRHVQIDAPCFTSFVNPRMCAVFESEGLDPQELLLRCVAADRRVVERLQHLGMCVSMHICRGNYRGQWFNEGAYDGIAAEVLGGLPVDQWLLEYDTDRAGTFTPLAAVPSGTKVVLGLVTTKSGVLESEAELLRRVDEAARFIPLDDLAISPQCGFASEVQGNPLSWDEQRRKLDLVVSAAQQVWGTPATK